MRIVFDDLRRRDPTWPPEWEMWAFITNAELPLEGFPRELTERQLAAIGKSSFQDSGRNGSPSDASSRPTTMDHGEPGSSVMRASRRRCRRGSAEWSKIWCRVPAIEDEAEVA